MNDNIDKYLSGTRLYGDNFTIDEIKEWFADEAEGYADLGAKDKCRYNYGYHELNFQHGYKFMHSKFFDNVLGLGSAYGDEFLPIINNINNITILDPSNAFSDVQKISGVPTKYVKPNINGDMSFQSNYFHLIVCLGVMHHIPNVSHILKECHRCLTKEGVMLLREPIVSMGDWRKPREGLTKRERGIPLNYMRKIILDAGFTIKHESLCLFPPISKLAIKMGVSPYNNYFFTLLDKIFSKAFAWNIKYHRTRLYHKISPTSICFILIKCD